MPCSWPALVRTIGTIKDFQLPLPGIQAPWVLSQVSPVHTGTLLYLTSLRMDPGRHNRAHQHLTITTDRVPGFLSSRPNWVPPSYHPQGSVAPTPLGSKGVKGVDTLACGGGGGGTQIPTKGQPTQVPILPLSYTTL
jgi:hypothetical protein